MEHENKPINIPNILTVSRILMTPLFVILLLKNMYGTALVIFTLAGISDALDGLIARCFNQRTAIGAYLDPVADKLLLSAGFVSLAVILLIPGWLAVIVISRDILILLAIALLSLTNTPVKINPSMISKCTTAAQLITIALALLGQQVSLAGGVLQTAFWITAGLTILSAFHYIYLGMNLMQSAAGNNNGLK